MRYAFSKVPYPSPRFRVLDSWNHKKAAFNKEEVSMLDVFGRAYSPLWIFGLVDPSGSGHSP